MPYDPKKWAEQSVLDVKRTTWGRWFLVLAIILNVCYVAVIVIRTADSPNRAPNIIPMFLLAVLAAYATPFARNFIQFSKIIAYDEFEKTVLMQATRRAYVALMLLGAALALWCCIGTMAPIVVPHEVEDWFAIAGAFVFIGALLPLCFAEFMVPMPGKDEQAEE